MEDYSHLRKAGGHDGEKDALLAEGDEHSPTEARECLESMKEISTLIADVFNLGLSFYLLIFYRALLLS
jgi:hypothetical protein